MKVPFEYFFGRLEFTTTFQYVFFEFDSSVFIECVLWCIRKNVQDKVIAKT
jgi:hypothetical protein